MRNEYFFTREAEGGIFVCAALTVREHRIELMDEACPNPHLPFGATQSPANDLSSAGVHPLDSGGCGQIARVRFHDQRIGIAFFEPVDKSALVAKIKCAAEQMNIFCFVVFCNLGFAAGDHFHGARLSCKQAHAFAGLRKQIKERDAVRGQDTLL